MYSLEDYAYVLPEHLIAQTPLLSRDSSRLMVLDRGRQTIHHYQFGDIVRLLRADDVLVVNDTRVIRARLRGTKETGGKIEVFLLNYPSAELTEKPPASPAADGLVCECMTRSSKPPRTGSRIDFTADVSATVLGKSEGIHRLAFHFTGNFAEVLENAGEVPLPPYIKRRPSESGAVKDREAYQTIYAQRDGAVAAPTAGLHFSEEVMDALRKKGIQTVSLTLHVGYGTFLPVRVTDIRDHAMHAEWYEIPEPTAAVVTEAKTRGRRVVAVGTTSVRSLEHSADAQGRISAGSGHCDLFIYPGYRFKVVDAMITNFHLPKSTLLMLVSAFASRRLVLKAYQEAVDRRYRFYSYGDGMFIY